MVLSREEVFENKIPNYIVGVYYFIDENDNIMIYRKE